VKKSYFPAGTGRKKKEGRREKPGSRTPYTVVKPRKRRWPNNDFKKPGPKPAEKRISLPCNEQARRVQPSQKKMTEPAALRPKKKGRGKSKKTG